MKTRAILAFPLIALLSACQTTGGSSVPAIPDSIKSAVITTCGVVLSAQSLAQLIPMVGASDVAAFAAKVCSVLTPLAQGRGGKVTVAGSLNGVRIVGTKVR